MNAGLARQLMRGSLAASRVRIALTVACIALGVAMASAVHTVHTSALAEIDRAARALAGRADLEVRGPRSGFDESVFLAIADRREVEAASPVVEAEAAVADSTNVVRVLGIDAFRAVRLQPAFLASEASTSAAGFGRLLDARSLWLSPTAAQRLRLKAGDTLPLRMASGVREYTIAGLLPGMDAAGDLAVMDIAAAQVDLDRVGRISRIDLRLRQGVDAARFAAEIQALLPAGVVIGGAASLTGRAAAISRAYRVNLDALAMVALATGAFLVFATLALQAARRRQEFALLRALGVTRRGLLALLAAEGALLGALGAVFGIALGLAGSRVLLQRSGTDLGAGYFGGHGNAFAPDPLSLAGIAALAIAMSIAGALQVARAVARIDVAEALRDRAVDLPRASGSGSAALVLALAGLPFLWLPPVHGLPVGGYAAIAFWLCASVAAVGPLCRITLARIPSHRSATAALALAQVRHLPGHLAASVAGIVVSASLCLAMAIMVHSFRESLQQWLGGVVRGDLYVSASPGASAAQFSQAEQQIIAALPQVARLEPLRYDRLQMGPDSAPLTLVARPIDGAILAGFQAEPPGIPARGAEIPVWITEAARDLNGWKVGERVEIPVAGRAVPVRIAGLVRDYARTWGAVLMDTADYRGLASDAAANDLVLHLRDPGNADAARGAIRTALPHATGLAFEDAAGLRARSLAIFDRSFAITYALEAIAIAIGLAGVTSSFAALAWSRRREFGVLRFLGLRRRDVLAMLALEGAAAGALGAAIGLASGVAISLVLVHVVNRQSFHWSMEVHWPFAALAALLAGIVATCALGARVSGALAVRQEAVLAVKDDA
ncbi:MAG TPA: ABC transporter permease [Usitatibacter sp.]|nr:ABC transporter permease [Usitatibacter sp.]